jgi:hypothetical protein
MFLVGGLEIQDFIDVLMRDLSLEVERKGGKGFLGLRAWAKEWFWSYMSKDYEGIVEEFWMGGRRVEYKDGFKKTECVTCGVPAVNSS